MALLTKISVLGSGKTLALYNLIFGVVFAILTLILKIFAVGPVALYGWGFAVLYQVVFIIAMPIMGFIAGIIIAWFLNWALKIGGGLEIKLE